MVTHKDTTKLHNARLHMDSSRGKLETEFVKQISKSKALLKIMANCNELVDDNNISIKAREHFNHKGSKLMIDYKITSIDKLREQLLKKATTESRKFESMNDSKDIMLYITLAALLAGVLGFIMGSI